MHKIFTEETFEKIKSLKVNQAGACLMGIFLIEEYQKGHRGASMLGDFIQWLQAKYEEAPYDEYDENVFQENQYVEEYEIKPEDVVCAETIEEIAEPSKKKSGYKKFKW